MTLSIEEKKDLVREAVACMRIVDGMGRNPGKEARKKANKRIDEIKKVLGIRRLGEVVEINVRVEIARFKF